MHLTGTSPSQRFFGQPFVAETMHQTTERKRESVCTMWSVLSFPSAVSDHFNQNQTQTDVRTVRRTRTERRISCIMEIFYFPSISIYYSSVAIERAARGVRLKGGIKRAGHYPGQRVPVLYVSGVGLCSVNAQQKYGAARCCTASRGLA